VAPYHGALACAFVEPFIGNLKHRSRWAFVGCIADAHPELIDDTPPPPPAPPKVRRETGPRLTDRYIRKVLGKREPFESAQDAVRYHCTLQRIARGDV
jgi:hypothetical protein